MSLFTDEGESEMASRKDKVNLDAMIKRQDLEARSDVSLSAPANTAFAVSELKDSRLTFELLRKPHFQRDTDDWSIDHVASFLKSFRDGHLIPSLILWRHEVGYTFVIDGAHRLSALVAWVNNDYGDDFISKRYFKEISKKQQRIADECRRIVEKEVGTYSGLENVLKGNPTPQQTRWAANITSVLPTQSVVGNADVAFNSFVAINQRAVQIDKTELFMIQHRNDADVIAARASVKAARGHQNFKDFLPENVEAIESKARAIYAAIFEPEDAESGTDIDLQPAGPAYTENGQRIGLELVRALTSNQDQTKKVDPTGGQVRKYMEITHGVVKYMAGSDSASLSLHPAVYFWGETGNHRPTAFLATALLVQEMVERNELREFTIHRARFEEFIVRSSVMKEIMHSYGGWKRSVGPVKRTLRTLFEGLKLSLPDPEIEKQIRDGVTVSANEDDEWAVEGRNAWKESKKQARWRASLDGALRCPICKARMVNAYLSDDHKIRRVDGGQSTAQNVQLTHHYCNHGFKEFYAQKGLPLPEISSPV